MTRTVLKITVVTLTLVALFLFTVRVSSIEVGNAVSTRSFSGMKLNAPADDAKFNMPSAARTP